MSYYLAIGVMLSLLLLIMQMSIDVSEGTVDVSEKPFVGGLIAFSIILFIAIISKKKIIIKTSCWVLLITMSEGLLGRLYLVYRDFDDPAIIECGQFLSILTCIALLMNKRVQVINEIGLIITGLVWLFLGLLLTSIGVERMRYSSFAITISAVVILLYTHNSTDIREAGRTEG